MQKVVRVKLTVEAYVREQYHRQMHPPSPCPNCGRFHRLWVHAYYERYTTDSVGKPIAFRVRRFRCIYCAGPVSCLPVCAQPDSRISHTHHAACLKERTRGGNGGLPV